MPNDDVIERTRLYEKYNELGTASIDAIYDSGYARGWNDRDGKVPTYDALADEVLRLREALEHYAAERNWIKSLDGGAYFLKCSSRDNGYDIARATLNTK